MSPILVLSTMAGYFALLFIIAYITGRKSDNQGFFVGNRKSPWFMVAIAMVGSSISGVTFISVPGWVADTGFSYLQMVFGFVVGQVIIAFVLIPLFYKMRLLSIYEYLENRFGIKAYRTGAWFFFISKMLGAAVRLFLVCVVLQLLLFDPLELPFSLNVIFTMLIVWLYTHKGGVKSLIWTDSLKTFCLLMSVGLCIHYIASDLNLSLSAMINSVADHDYSRIFFFDDVNDKRFFFKQFFAGLFTVIATTGLDQDMMQRTLSCKNFKDAQKNMVTSGVAQIFIISLFLILGVLLYIFVEGNGITPPEKSDQLFPLVATQGYLPTMVGVLFIVGLISSAYSAAGSALTALTTSFTVDIVQGGDSSNEESTTKVRKRVHIVMALVMAVVIYIFNMLNNTSVIDAVYILASYTYGPILGLFAFGISTKKAVRDRYIPIVAIVAPILCYLLQTNSERWFGGYQFSYELLIFNALFTYIGLCILIRRDKKEVKI